MTDDVHAGKLRPDLGEDTNVGAVDHVWLEQFEVRHIGVSALKLAHIFDFLEFLKDEWRFTVALGVD